MRAPMPLRLAGVLATAASTAVLGLTASPAIAESRHPASLGLAAGRYPSNVGATHSPQLLRQLAGGTSAADSPVSSRLLTPLTSTGALSGAL